MDPLEIFDIPRRSELRFGEPLENVFENGLLHDGLKDLFLKAYISARGDDCRYNLIAKEANNLPSPVLLALKSGPSGQGSLSQRLYLKSKLESGEWLMPLQTPPGSPLWLLRHFLGRLPQPLLQGSQWKIVGRACAASAVPSASGTDESRSDVGQVLERIAALIAVLSPIESRLLSLVALLARKLSTRNAEIVSDDLDALSQYFISSIIVRPFRPGLYTPIDEDCRPLLVFLSIYWDEIFGKFDDSKTTSNQLGSIIFLNCTVNVTIIASFDAANEINVILLSSRFESLLIVQCNKRSKESSANDSSRNNEKGRKTFALKLLDLSCEELENLNHHDDVPRSEHEYFSAPNSEDSQ